MLSFMDLWNIYFYGFSVCFPVFGLQFFFQLFAVSKLIMQEAWLTGQNSGTMKCREFWTITVSFMTWELCNNRNYIRFLSIMHIKGMIHVLKLNNCRRNGSNHCCGLRTDTQRCQGGQKTRNFVRNSKILIARSTIQPLKNASKYIRKLGKKFNFQFKKYFLVVKNSLIIDLNSSQG